MQASLTVTSRSRDVSPAPGTLANGSARGESPPGRRPRCACRRLARARSVADHVSVAPYRSMGRSNARALEEELSGLEEAVRAAQQELTEVEAERQARPAVAPAVPRPRC